MLEYVFFHQQPRDMFVSFLRERAVESTLSEEDGVFEVAIPEDVDDELSEQIEGYYEQMMALNQALVDSGSSDDHHTAGVVLNLQDGRTVYADVNPYLLGKIMEVLTPEELGEVVNAVVDAIESPDERTLCQRKGE